MPALRATQIQGRARRCRLRRPGFGQQETGIPSRGPVRRSRHGVDPGLQRASDKVTFVTGTALPDTGRFGDLKTPRNWTLAFVLRELEHAELTRSETRMWAGAGIPEPFGHQSRRSTSIGPLNPRPVGSTPATDLTRAGLTGCWHTRSLR